MCLFVIIAWCYIHSREDESSWWYWPVYECNMYVYEYDTVLRWYRPNRRWYRPKRRWNWPQRRGNGLHCNTSANVCLLWASSPHVHLILSLAWWKTMMIEITIEEKNTGWYQFTDLFPDRNYESMTMRRELTEIGKAYLRAMAAKNISRQMRKFW